MLHCSKVNPSLHRHFVVQTDLAPKVLITSSSQKLAENATSRN
jgi:hypothetical protein